MTRIVRRSALGTHSDQMCETVGTASLRRKDRVSDNSWRVDLAGLVRNSHYGRPCRRARVDPPRAARGCPPARPFPPANDGGLLSRPDGAAEDERGPALRLRARRVAPCRHRALRRPRVCGRERTSELGIRAALGATPRQLRWELLGQALAVCGPAQSRVSPARVRRPAADRPFFMR